MNKIDMDDDMKAILAETEAWFAENYAPGWHLPDEITPETSEMVRFTVAEVAAVRTLGEASPVALRNRANLGESLIRRYDREEPRELLEVYAIEAEPWMKELLVETVRERYAAMRSRARRMRLEAMKGLVPSVAKEELDVEAARIADLPQYYSCSGWTRRGLNWWVRCPFHDERSASLAWHSGRKLWHCHGCGAGGDNITFAMKHDECSFAEAVRRLSN